MAGELRRRVNQMNFLDAEFVQGFIRMANDGWEQGWHERNGGNLSYRVKPQEAESVKENFKTGEWRKCDHQTGRFSLHD